MTSIDGVTIEAALLCEDVREEVNRKHALLGVFAGDVLVQSFPATIKFAVYVVMKVTESKQRTLAIRARFDADQGGIMAQASLGPEHSGISVAIIPQFYVTTEVPGRFVVEISAEEGKWMELVSKAVSQGVIPSVTPPILPPS